MDKMLGNGQCLWRLLIIVWLLVFPVHAVGHVANLIDTSQVHNLSNVFVSFIIVVGPNLYNFFKFVVSFLILVGPS